MSHLWGLHRKMLHSKCCFEISKFKLDLPALQVMGNHFHILLCVPEREKALARFLKGSAEQREAKLLDHLRLLYSAARFIRQTN